MYSFKSENLIYCSSQESSQESISSQEIVSSQESIDNLLCEDCFNEKGLGLDSVCDNKNCKMFLKR